MKLHGLHKYHKDAAGSTIVESLVVVVVIIVLSAIAVIQFAEPRNQFTRKNVSIGLKTAIERARFDSVKRRAVGSGSQAKVILTSTTFKLVVDANVNGTLETSDEVLTSFSGKNISITGAGLVFPVTIYLNQRGEATALDGNGAAISPVFRVCTGSCSTPTNRNSELLIVTPSGTVNLLPGSSSAPTFAAPTVTSVSGGTDVDPLVTVP